MLLEVKNLNKSYGKIAAVRNISFSADEGEIIGFIGPNGAGKTTTINMLSGIIKPDSGNIFFKDEPVRNNIIDWKRSIGLVLEELALFDHLSIKDNMIFTAQLYGLQDAEKRSDELLDFLYLKDQSNTLISESSHGMKKKTAFALSIIHNPKILFLDEAFTGIDAVTIKNIKELLKKLKKKGVLIFISSHILDSIEPLIDRYIIIKNGNIILNSAYDNLKGKTLEQIYTAAITGSNCISAGLSWV